MKESIITILKALAMGMCLVLFANYGQAGLDASAYSVFASFILGAALKYL